MLVQAGSVSCFKQVAIIIKAYSVMRAGCQQPKCPTELDLTPNRKQLTSNNVQGVLLIQASPVSTVSVYVGTAHTSEKSFKNFITNFIDHQSILPITSCISLRKNKHYF